VLEEYKALKAKEEMEKRFNRLRIADFGMRIEKTNSDWGMRPEPHRVQGCHAPWWCMTDFGLLIAD